MSTRPGRSRRRPRLQAADDEAGRERTPPGTDIERSEEIVKLEARLASAKKASAGLEQSRRQRREVEQEQQDRERAEDLRAEVERTSAPGAGTWLECACNLWWFACAFELFLKLSLFSF